MSTSSTSASSARFSSATRTSAPARPLRRFASLLAVAIGLAAAAAAVGSDATALHAATLKGIPAASKGVLHFDATTGTPFATALKTRLLSAAGDEAAQEATFGFAPARDIHDITIGIIPPPPPPATTPPAAPAPAGIVLPAPAAAPQQGVVLIRGKFDASKVVENAGKKAAATATLGGRPFLNAAFLASVLPFARPEKILIGAADANTLLVADADGARDSIAAFDAAAPSWPVPAALQQFREATGVPFFFGCLTKELFPRTARVADEAPPPDTLFFALGEDKGTLKFQLSGLFPTPADARKSGAQFRALLSLWKMSFADVKGVDGRPDRVKEARYARVTKLHDAAQFHISGNNFRVTLEFPVSEALALLNAR